MMVHDSFADKAVIMDGTWVIISDGNFTLPNTQNVEKRKYGMSNADIEAKFKIREQMIRKANKRIKKLKETLSGADLVPSTLTDKLSTAEANITTMQGNQEKMKTSIEAKCQQLDRLFEPDQHCCVGDYYMICVPDALVGTGANDDFAFPSSHAAGECPECPEKLKELFPTSGVSRRKLR